MVRVGAYSLLALERRSAREEVWRALDAQGAQPGHSGQGLQPGHSEPGREVTLERLLFARGLPADLRRRLAARIHLLQQLRHPGLLALLGAGEAEGVPFLVWERPEGSSLAARLERGPLAPAQARELARSLGETLAACHAQGLLHGDLRPAHVLLCEGSPPLLGGFDLAWGAGCTDVPGRGAAPGDEGFRAPELAQGAEAHGHRVDVYGLGALLYAALTGVAPGRPVQRPSRVRAGVPAWLDEVCLRALAADPAARTADMASLTRELARGPGRRRRRLTAVLLVGLSAGLGALLLAFRPPPAPPPPVAPPPVAPPSAHALLGQAGAKARGGDLRGALADLDRAVALDPGLARAWRERALARGLLGDLSGALADLDQALELDPRDGNTLVERAAARRTAGDLAGAIRDLDQAVAVAPDMGAAWYNRGNARWAAGDVRAGIEDFTRAIEVDPLLAEAYVNRANARADVGDREGALEDYARALELAPMPLIHYNRAVLFHEAGDLQSARRDLDQALELRPDLQPAWTERGTNRWWAGDMEGARADFDRALDLLPTDVRALANRAIVKRRQGDLAGAQADLDRSLELEPQQPQALVNRASLRLELGDVAGAVADSQQAVTLAPRQVQTWVGLGLALEQAGDREGAREALRRALKLEPRGEYGREAREALNRLEERNRE